MDDDDKGLPSNIIPLQEVAPRLPEDTIDMLHDLLKRAYRGEVLGVAVVALTSHDSVLAMTDAALESPDRSLGALSRLSHKINIAADG